MCYLMLNIVYECSVTRQWDVGGWWHLCNGATWKIISVGSPLKGNKGTKYRCLKINKGSKYRCLKINKGNKYRCLKIVCIGNL